MLRTPVLLGLLALCSTLAQAQPVIRAGSVVNAASYIQPGLPNYGIAQGGMFILKGQNLGARGTVVANAFPLSTNMGGTSMRITVAGTAVDVLMVYVAAGPGQVDQVGPFDQLAGIVPSTTPTGSGAITVTFNGQTSAPVSITIVASEFGIFTINQAGTGPGVFTDPNFKVNTLIHVAHPGDLLFIWGTGLGPINGSDANTPPVGNLNVPVEVYVGNVKAAVTYQGRSGCCAGIDQILFTVPAGVQGCYVPVAVKTGNVVSNFVTVSLAPSGDLCSDPQGFTTSELQKAQSNAAITVADISLTRLSAKISVPVLGTIQGNVDNGEGHFWRYSNDPNGVLASSRGSIGALPGFPSAGCTVVPYTPPGSGLFDNFLPPTPDPAVGLDAGPALNVMGPRGAKQIPRRSRGGVIDYAIGGGMSLGGGLPPVTPVTPEYLLPGSYRLDNGSGGPDVGAFSAMVAIPASSFVWTNEDAVAGIPRSQDLTLTWSGSGLVGIVGNSTNAGATAGAMFVCVATSGTSLTIPAWVLSALPVSGTASDVPVSIGFLGVGTTLSSPARFQVRGVDAGYVNWALLQVKNVRFE